MVSSVYEHGYGAKRSPFGRTGVNMTPLYTTHPALARVENNNDHRIAARTPAIDYIPRGLNGAEIGVFTGVFSEYLMRRTQPRWFVMVDAWDTLGADSWQPSEDADWAPYVDHGNLTPEMGRDAAAFRANHLMPGGTQVITSLSLDWLREQQSESFDWVYLDTTHTYDDTIAELDAIARILRPDGLILGDDAWRDHPVFKVLPAIRDFTRKQPWEIVYLADGQFVLRRDR